MYEYRNRTRYLAPNPNSAIPGVYGNTLAARFIQDVVSGKDSLDIIVIGDSNAGSNDYGYTVGWDRFMGYELGCDMYATPLLPGGADYILSGPTYPTQLQQNMASNGVIMYGELNGTTGGTGSTGPMRQFYKYTDSGGPIDSLVTYLGVNSTNYTNFYSTMLLQPNRFSHFPNAIASGEVYGSDSAFKNSIRLLDDSPLMYGGSTNLSYRLVHGLFSSGSGSFKLRVMGSGATIGNSISTNAGITGYATSSIPFTASATCQCTWDGGTTAQASGTLCTGPFAAIWQSIIRTSKKGYSVTNLTTSDSRTMVALADRIEGCGLLLDAFLSEIHNRQKEAGGSGRVLVFVNGGINGDTATNWTSAADRIVARIKNRWPGSMSNLSFVFTVSHPMTSSYVGSGNAWVTGRAAVSAAANNWGLINVGNNACVVDINVKYPPIKLQKGSTPTGLMYANLSSDQLHLNSSFTSRSNGYDAVVGSIANSILLSLPNLT